MLKDVAKPMSRRVSGVCAHRRGLGVVPRPLATVPAGQSGGTFSHEEQIEVLHEGTLVERQDAGDAVVVIVRVLRDGPISRVRIEPCRRPLVYESLGGASGQD